MGFGGGERISYLFLNFNFVFRFLGKILDLGDDLGLLY